MLYTSSWLRFEFTTPVVMGTDFIGSCKSNNHDGPSSLFEWIQDPYIILAETCHTKRRYLSKCTRDVSGSQFFFCAAIIHNVKWTKYFFIANYINLFMDKRLIVYGVVTGDQPPIIHSLSMKTTPIQIFAVRKLYIFIYRYLKTMHYSIIVYSWGNCSPIVLREHYTSPDNTIGKLFSREKITTYLVHNIPF